MANSKGSSNMHNMIQNGKNSLLPPRIPLSSNAPMYMNFIPGNVIGSKSVQKPMEENSHHQRALSETLVMEEQPYWLDDLLNEPETPVRQLGHRRSSSDSFAYVDGGNNYHTDYLGQDEYFPRNKISMPLWGSQDFEFYKDSRKSNLYGNSMTGKVNAMARSGATTSAIESVISSNPLNASSLEVDAHLREQKEPQEFTKSINERKDGSQLKSGPSDNDTKRAKQQFAQRSRVRKLQYIAELERNVQALQAEGSEFSAELEFINQQNFILNMENKALKQRLESLSQEHLIKRLEHDVLEREIGRLQNMYHQQQQQPLPQKPSGHRRNNSKDLECQFANLSIKQKNGNTPRDSTSDPLR